ncbi:unnamed protein product [Mytilus edulis]|uniref:Uncharacterized protein n=1 Tax=Mytilus edulis TaxID=6550 RepID=A0A8S3SWG5_MYTED|nr:unnamed protein product [Mytilus edulis]
MNALEGHILDDLESKLKSNMNTLVQQIEQRASQINGMQSQFTIMTRYATELQMYVGLREIEKISAEAAIYVEDLQSGNPFDENNLEFNISSKLQSILQDVKSFGDVDINTISSTLNIKAGRKGQAQHLILYSRCHLGESNQTALVDVEMNKVIRKMKLPHECNGVASEREIWYIPILSEADGIKDPFAIDINRDTGMMVVASKHNEINDSDNSGDSDDSACDDDRLYETVFVYQI